MAMEVDDGAKASSQPAGDPMEVDEAYATSKIFEEMLEKARDLESTNPEGAVQAYKDIINNKDQIDDPGARGREEAIYKLAEFLVAKERAQQLAQLSTELRPLLAELPKAKTAKIVRALLDLMAKIPNSQALQITMCRDCIEWCKGEKRTFLRQRVETKLAALLLGEQQFQETLELLTKLLAEVKKLDDKLLLVDIYLIECRTHYRLGNIPKSKAALTAAKTNANAIHCPPLVQADIDLWSGIITAREKDYRTAYSYFYEAFEAFHASDKPETHAKAQKCMKLMLLTKIMQNRTKDIEALINSKQGLSYTGVEIDAMRAIAKVHQERSLKKFEAVLLQYKPQLADDKIIEFHLTDLHETLLEQNILRILEPFSKVEIAHVAELLELPEKRTQAKLREMILDQKLNGTLDQGIGVLIVFDQEQVRSTYDNALKTIKNTSEVLDTLHGMAKQLG